MRRSIPLALAAMVMACAPSGTDDASALVEAPEEAPAAHVSLADAETTLRGRTETELRAHEGTALERVVAAYLLRDDEALERALDQLAAEAPESEALALYRALAQRDRGEHREALAALRPILRETSDPWVFYHGAATYLDAGLLAEADRYAEEALAREGARPLYEAAHVRATALRQQGRYDEARAVAERAVVAAEAVGASTLSARFQLARLFGATGDLDQARAHFATCVATADAMRRGEVDPPVGTSPAALGYLAGKAETYLGLIGIASDAPMVEVLAHFETSRSLLTEAAPGSPLAETEGLTQALALAVSGEAEAARQVLEAVPAIMAAPTHEVQLRTLAYMGDWEQVLARTQNVEDTHAGGSPFDADRLRTLLREGPCADGHLPFAGCEASLEEITGRMSCLMRRGDFRDLVMVAGEALRCPGRADTERTVFNWYLTLGADMEEQREALRAQVMDFASGS